MFMDVLLKAAFIFIDALLKAALCVIVFIDALLEATFMFIDALLKAVFMFIDALLKAALCVIVFIDKLLDAVFVLIDGLLNQGRFYRRVAQGSFHVHRCVDQGGAFRGRLFAPLLGCGWVATQGGAVASEGCVHHCSAGLLPSVGLVSPLLSRGACTIAREGRRVRLAACSEPQGHVTRLGGDDGRHGC